MTIAKPAPLRFWAKVQFPHPNACWTWTGSLRLGYGRFGLRKGRNVNAHRFAYELLVGPIPAGMHLDHLCRNPSCVNPAHLEPVTQRVNNLRGVGFGGRNARAAECPRGHPYTPENTYVRPDGTGRDCMSCRRIRNKATVERRKRERRARRALSQ